MGNKNTSALDGATGAPANYAGTAAPIDASFGDGVPVTGSSISSSTGGRGRASASADANAILRLAAVIVIGAVILLWLLGGIVFKNANI